MTDVVLLHFIKDQVWKCNGGQMFDQEGALSHKFVE